MPSIQGSLSLAANITLENVLVTEGKSLRTIPIDAIAVCDVFLTGSAVGLEVSFFAAERRELQSAPVSTQNRIPIDPDDKVLTGVVAQPVEELGLQCVNTTGGALTLFYRIDIQYSPLAI